nr:VOC family protein [Nakamurella leprariae]
MLGAGVRATGRGGRRHRDRTAGRHGRLGWLAADHRVPASLEPKTAKLRLHLDVNPTDRDQDAELERLLDLGARTVDIGQRGDESWHVLADPEGNEFCLLRARVSA